MDVMQSLIKSSKECINILKLATGENCQENHLNNFNVVRAIIMRATYGNQKQFIAYSARPFKLGRLVLVDISRELCKNILFMNLQG